VSRTKSETTILLEEMREKELDYLRSWAKERTRPALITKFVPSAEAFEDYMDWFEPLLAAAKDELAAEEISGYGLNRIRFSLALKKLGLAIPDKSGGRAILRSLELKSAS